MERWNEKKVERDAHFNEKKEYFNEQAELFNTKVNDISTKVNDNVEWDLINDRIEDLNA